MKVETIERDIQRSDSFQERSMGLAVGSESFVFNVLRKDLYSDPIGSLIREYTVNAQDEHRKHGIADKPIMIQVPNRFLPELHIRDYAGGLTEEQVFHFFGNYGASDKRDTNVAVGFFGLGCKSAFAYTDSYVVKSFKDGKAYTFNIYIDETEIGRVAKIAEEDTDEPNGVLIIVPVKTQDISAFERKVISTVTYFETKPVIKGLSYEPVFEKKKAVISGDGWEYYGKGSVTVLMGEIAYPVDRYSMGSDLESWENSLLASDILLNLEIGDVQVTASREALQMSPKTIAAIRAKLLIIKDAMKAETEKAFKDAKNIIEAKAIYQSVIASGSGYGDIIRNSGDKIIWNGQEIKDSYIRFNDFAHHVSNYRKDYRGRIKLVAGDSFQCEPGKVIYFDDTNKTKVNYKRRATTLLANVTDYRNAIITIIHSNDVPALEKMLGMSVKDFLSYNAVVPTIPVSTRGAGNGVDLSKRVKHTSKVFVLNIGKALRFVKGAASDCWNVKDVEIKGGVYINIDRFHPNTQTMSNLQDLRRKLEQLQKVGIDVKVPIYGFKGGEKVDGLISFDDWVTRKLDDRADLKREFSLIKTYHSHNLLDVRNLNIEKLSDESIAKHYAIVYQHLLAAQRKDYSSTLQSLYTRFEIAKDETLAKLSDAVREKYPMLRVIDSYRYGKDEVTDYINEREAAV